MHPLYLTANDRKTQAKQEKDFLSKWPVYPLGPPVLSRAYEANKKNRQSLLALWDAWSRQPTTSQPDPRLRQMLLQVKIIHSMQYFLFFPMGDLPAEIITNIFRFVAWSTHTPDESVNTRVGLTHVCRQWRAIAIADHTLWSAIWFRDKFPYTRSLTFIDRAGQAPLDIRVSDPNEAEALTDAHMKYLLDRLFQKVGTIRMLIILCYKWEPVLTVLERLHQALRAGTPLLLQRFELHRLGDPYLWPGSAFIPAGHPVTKFPMVSGPLVPRLTYVSVNAIHFDWRASIIRDLTTLDIRRLPLDHALESSVFRSMLINCPRLEKLALDGAGPDGPPMGRNQAAPVELNYLKILVLANFTPSYVQGIAGHFAAPNVRDLTIMNLFRHEYTELYVFLAGRYPKVRILTLYTLQVTKGLGHTAMVKFLGSMTEVRYIRIALLEAYGLSTFLYDPETMAPHRLPSYERGLFRSAGAPRMTLTDHPEDEGRKKKTTQPKTYVFPDLSVAEVQSIQKEWLEAWLACRKAMGLPLHTLYLQGDLSKYTKEDVTRLSAYVSKLAIIGTGQKTPEEETSLS